MTTISKMPRRYDVVIVGARCAGAATAMLLAGAGVRVLVVDRDEYGSDTISTHALMRTGVALLNRWGVLDGIVAAGTPLVHRTTFAYGDDEIAIDIRPDDDVPGLFAPRRTVLDRHLVDVAIAAGAEFRFGVSAAALTRDETGRFNGVTIRDKTGRIETVAAGLVIGADGRNSMVARAAGAGIQAAAPATAGGVFGYFSGIRNAGYRWHFREGAHVSVIPTNGGMHCVCAIVPRAGFRHHFGQDSGTGFTDLVRSFSPSLAEAVSSGRHPAQLRRWTGAPGHIRQCHGPGWALVGDAGYFKDPLTAHGITDALRDAALLAHAVLADHPGAFAEYEATRNRLSRRLFEITREIAAFEWTLERLQALHVDLNTVMKAEHAFMQDHETHWKLSA